MDNTPPPDDASWIEGIRRGDEDAFASLTRAYYTALFDFARRIARSPQAAEDLVQDVLLAVWEGRADWHPRGSARAYLFRAVRNRALNFVRDRAQHRAGNLAPDEVAAGNEAGPEAEMRYQHLMRDYRNAVDELPERRRLVFRLSRLYGLTYQEIADVLDVSINTVRSQMSAALAHLRERLDVYL